MKLTGERARLESLHSKAHSAAVSRGKPVLMCWNEPVSATDPLAWLETLTDASENDPGIRSLLNEGSVYWTHPSDGFAFAGAGAAVIVDSDGENRFRAAELAWSELIEGAVRDDRGRGPILTGGFAFDPHGAKGEEWVDFQSSRLILPRVMITSAADGCWVTVSAMVDPADRQGDGMQESLSRLYSLGASRLAAPFEPDEGSPSELSCNDEKPASAWRSLVADAVAEIDRGELDKVVLARSVRASAGRDIDTFALLRELRDTHRDAFTFGFWRGSKAFVGASPERLVGLEGSSVSASSLAGTIRRDADPIVDRANAAELLASVKDQWEHTLVRDALTDALAEVCDDVTASARPVVLSLRQVHHLHTEVRATLRPGHSLLDLVGRLHPTPAVGGSPREAALAFIRDREDLDRGWYAGPVGWVGLNGGEFAVALRSALVAGSSAILFAGCGIVAGSDPDLELAESVLKLKVMQSALESALAPLPAAIPEADLAGRS